MAGLTMVMCMQLKGCVQATYNDCDNNESNGSDDDGPSTLQMVLWTVLEFALNRFLTVTYYVFRIWWIIFLMVQTAGVRTLAFAVFFMPGGPMIWRKFQFLRVFSTCNARG